MRKERAKNMVYVNLLQYPYYLSPLPSSISSWGNIMEIEFIEFKNRFEVLFIYNPDIVKVMRRFRGRYIPGPPIRWAFPLERKEALAKELRELGYSVDDSHFTLANCIKKEKQT